MVPSPQGDSWQREGGRVGESGGGEAWHARGGTAPTPAVPRQPQAGDLGEEVARGANMGRRAHLQVEIPHAETTEAERSGSQQHQGARLKVLPAKDRTRPHRAVLTRRKGTPHCRVLMVPMPGADKGPPLQGVPGMEDAAEDPVGGGEEGDQEVEEQVDGPGPAGRREVRAGSAGLPLLHGRGKAGAPAGEE